MWSEGRDISDAEVLKDIVSQNNLDWTELQDHMPQAKITLRQNTERAIALGVCGVPTLHHDQALWWGQDRIYDFIVSLNTQQ